MDHNQGFLFDEYFSGSDIEIHIPYKGKLIPFRIKRALTLKERQQANDAAIQVNFDSKGKPNLQKNDQAAYTNEIILVGLKFWPFEYRPGKPVPINRETVAKLDGNLADEIAARILGAVEVDESALDPFVKESDEASSPEDQPARN